MRRNLLFHGLSALLSEVIGVRKLRGFLRFRFALKSSGQLSLTPMSSYSLHSAVSTQLNSAPVFTGDCPGATLSLHRPFIADADEQLFTHHDRTACHVVFRSLGDTDSPTIEREPPFPGTPPSHPRPPASARLKRSKSLKPSSHHEHPAAAAASHTGERGDATAPQLEPPAPQSSSLPLLASNLREGQAMG